MSNKFDKKMMFNNIYFMLKKTGKKIGELESEAGVSSGYISRTSKDEKTKPGVEFVINVAKALDVSLDTLINVDMSGLTATEEYLLSFISKLKEETKQDKLKWNRESKDMLNRIEPYIDGSVEHPLFSYETFFEEGETDYPEEVSRVVMLSHSFDCHTAVAGDCFNLKMKNGAILYIMNLSKSVHRINDISAFVKEIWMYKQGTGNQFLCKNTPNTALSSLVDDLYNTVSENSKHPVIDSDLRYIIDSFMKGDNEDDDIELDDLPF